MKARNVNKKVRYYTVNNESVMRFKGVNVPEHQLVLTHTLQHQ
jgi:hypothetical protein